MANCVYKTAKEFYHTALKQVRGTNQQFEGVHGKFMKSLSLCALFFSVCLSFSHSLSFKFWSSHQTIPELQNIDLSLLLSLSHVYTQNLQCIYKVIHPSFAPNPSPAPPNVLSMGLLCCQSRKQEEPSPPRIPSGERARGERWSFSLQCFQEECVEPDWVPWLQLQYPVHGYRSFVLLK